MAPGAEYRCSKTSNLMPIFYPAHGARVVIAVALVDWERIENAANIWAIATPCRLPPARRVGTPKGSKGRVNSAMAAFFIEAASKWHHLLGTVPKLLVV